ncbi:acyltransferase [Escherichia coli]|nr:acyltransferase [Escherichia coli]
MNTIVEYQQIFFLFSTLILGVVAVKLFGFVRKADSVIDKSRLLQLDGVRFFLASSVMFSHSTLMYNYITKQHYKTDMFAFMAMFGVASFFAITGFLFWGFVRKSENPDWVKIFFNRFFRIAPLVIFNAALIIITIYIYARISGVESSISARALYWFDFINNNKPDFNGIKDAWVATYGVHWTLVYEWGFYFSLPLLWMIGSGKKSTALVISGIFVLIYILPILTVNTKLGFNIYSLLHFLVGMLACELNESVKLKKSVANSLFSIAAASIIGFMYYTGKLIYNPSSYVNVMVFLVIFLLYKGADLFGLLRMKPFVLLGEAREGANKQVISSQADSLIKISRIWADFFPANTSNQPI